MAVSLDGITSFYNNNNVNASDSKADKLKESVDGRDFSNASKEELMEVCKEFEAYFTEQVFKSMKKMVPKEEKSSSYANQMNEYFEELTIQKYADQSAESGSLGLAQQLYESMKRNYGIED